MHKTSDTNPISDNRNSQEPINLTPSPWNLSSIHRRWFIPGLIGFLCSLVLMLLSGTRVVKFLEYYTYDWRVALRGKPVFAPLQAPTHYKNPDIVVVPVDDRSEELLTKPSLFWTRDFALVYSYLIKNEAAVIAQDFVFMVSLQSFLREEIDRFIEELRNSGKITEDLDDLADFYPAYDLPYYTVLYQATGRGENPEDIIKSKIILTVGMSEESSVILPWESFIRAVSIANVGLVTSQPDSDGVIRKQHLYKTTKTKYQDHVEFFTMDLLVASRFLHLPIKHTNNLLHLGNLPIPHDTSYLLHINYIAPPGTFTKEFSFGDLLNKAREDDNEFFQRNFKGKAVLIGPAYTGSTDIALTPYSSRQALEMYGIEVHANLLNTILNRDFIRQASRKTSFIILLLFGISTAFLSYNLRPLVAVLISIITGALYTALCFFLLYRFNLWINLAQILLVIPMVYSATYVYRYMVEDREKRHIRKVLGRYISESVAQEILKDPSNLTLGGKRADVSILFCDINDFTTYSEKTPPEEVIEILNDYFTRMEQVIFENRGTLKQFVGDEIMVVCGAPGQDPDHAVRCCTIAVEMVEELRRWQEQRRQNSRYVFEVKFGIHSGTVIAGNVGSPNRTEYTTIGDVVNTTSRIMGLTKQAGATILISEETCRQVKDRFEVEDKGTFPVKGREEHVRVYTLLGRKKNDSTEKE